MQLYLLSLCLCFFRTSVKKVITGAEKLTGWEFLDMEKLIGHESISFGVLLLRYPG